MISYIGILKLIYFSTQNFNKETKNVEFLFTNLVQKLSQQK